MDSTEGHSSVGSAGDSGARDVEDTALQIVSATANIILPFEMIKKALSLDYGTETSFPEGENDNGDNDNCYISDEDI